MWQPSDRNGRIPLVVSFEDKGARWIVVGDSTPFLNTQLLATSDAAERILEMASLWPNFFKDLVLVALSFLTILAGWRATRVFVVIFLGFIAVFVHNKNSEESRSISHSVGLSAFSDKNFNSALLDSPKLIESDWNLARVVEPISGSIPLKKGKTILFAHVDETARIGEIVLTSCRRLGNIQSPDGPFLMDAQACSVSGSGDVLIGDPDSTAAVRVGDGDNALIVILDTSFLGQKAPKKNAEWLIDAVDRAERKKLPGES